MSACFGEFRRDGRAVDDARLLAMAAAIPWYGKDGQGLYCQASIGLGVLRCYTTPESLHELPIQIATGAQHILAGNYRIDNRAELTQALALSPPPNRPLTDAELILAAYGTWGKACGKHLIGDFALAIWDGAQQQLLLIRDQLGIAPLYYYPTAWGLIFASDLRALAAHPEGPRELDPVAILHHLRDRQYLLPTTTYLAGVRKLQPGHGLTATTTASHEHPYWSPKDAPKVSLPDADAYAQRLRRLFEQAVACRLRTLHPVGTHLSGGLDSSAIALEAQHQLQARGESLAGAYSWLPPLGPGDDPDAPEYAATRRAEAALGMPAESVELTPATLRQELNRNIALEGYANLWYETLVRDKAKIQGIRTLLSGWGGDEAVSSGPRGYAAELFWTGHWLRLVGLVRSRIDLPLEQSTPVPPKPAWRRALGCLYGQVFLPSLPKAIYCRWRGMTRSPMEGFDAADLDMATVQMQPPLPCDGQRKVGKRREMTRALMAGHLQARIEAWAAQGARDDIQYVYPLLDLRLIEFCLGTPPALFAHPKQTRGLFREVMRGLLPEEIRLASVKRELARVTKGMASLRAALYGEGNDDAEALRLSMQGSRQIQVAAMRSLLGTEIA